MNVTNAQTINNRTRNLTELISQEVYYNFKCDITGTGNRSVSI